MKIPHRLEHAIVKLYTAFHGGLLNPENSQYCAVGNICDNVDTWKHFTDDHGSLELSYVGKVHQAFGKKINGYTPHELIKIEAAFLKGCGYSLPFRPQSKRTIDRHDKEVQFKGLCEVVACLCALDKVNNIMNFSKLFEFENDRPVYQLQF